MDEPFQVAGRIKWYDTGHGYGFVTASGLPDVFLHASHLLAAGYVSAPEGASVLCEAERWPRGLRVCRIVSMDVSTAVPPRTHTQVEPESDWERAEVKWFNRVRGFGFLTLGAGLPDIFLHMETARAAGFLSVPRPGQPVHVRWGMGPKGRMAADLRPVR